jgi:hypothetical protein
MFCRSKKGRLYEGEGEECDRAEDSFHSLANTGCGINSELIINKNNILLKVIDVNFSRSQFTMVRNFFYIVSLFVYNVF